ncbi:MAG TPA: 4'-phosphopantetheinyl transferase superfamily protein [Paenalcaligenes sp.]|nr:4'-phosphopantetheinyl transferase superfamily protein [Paenalcaligenes sp.]
MSPIHIYHLDTSLFPQLHSEYFSCLKPADWKRVRALKQESDQIHRQLAYACTYWLLQHHAAVSSHMLHINYDALGKPFTQSLPQWHINWSHSGQQLCIALAHTPVGIDIEHHQAIDPKSLLSHYFPNDPSPEGCLSAFYDLWVCKEALLKAQGMGLRVEPCNIVLHTPSPTFSRVAASPAALGLEHYTYALVPCPAQYSCAVATRGQVSGMLLHTLDLAALQQLKPAQHAFKIK